MHGIRRRIWYVDMAFLVRLWPPDPIIISNRTVSKHSSAECKV